MSIELISQIIMQGITIAVVIYVGLHLRQTLRSAQTTVDTQKTTIDAQVKHREDFEAVSRVMKQEIEVLDPQKQLQRERSYRERADRDADDRTKDLIKQLTATSERIMEKNIDTIMHDMSGSWELLSSMLPFLHPSLRTALIEAADLHPDRKTVLQQIAQQMSYRLITDDASLDQLRVDPFFPAWALPPQRVAQEPPVP